MSIDLAQTKPDPFENLQLCLPLEAFPVIITIAHENVIKKPLDIIYTFAWRGVGILEAKRIVETLIRDRNIIVCFSQWEDADKLRKDLDSIGMQDILVSHTIVK